MTVGDIGWLEELLNRSTQPVRSRNALRQECTEKGHHYQIHGKTNPNKLACARCESSWGIGPRTEPS